MITIFQKLEQKYCINKDRREIGQAYFRPVIFLICVIYSLGVQFTPYMHAVSMFAFIATIVIIVCVWRRVGRDRLRHLCTLAYDALIVGLVLKGLGSGFIGLYGILLWIPMGYGLRYRDVQYLYAGIIFMVGVFFISAIVTPWLDWRVFIALAITLVLLPIFGFAPSLKRVNNLVEKLNSANQVKDKFLSNMSHDLLTPVSSIMAYCEAIQHKSPEVDDIATLADQLSRQIRAIIGQTTPTTNAEHLEVFSPLKLLQTNLTIVRPLASSRNIRVKIEANENMGYYYGAADVVFSCLMNLANNAAKYTDGPMIILGAKFLNEHLHFFVTDTGTGITEEHQAKIFERFYRINPTNEVKGSGIGLTIVKESVERAGGKINVESEPNRTCFYFSIPAYAAATPTPTPTPTPVGIQQSNSAGGLLFVDDEHSARNAWSLFLRKSGHHVHVAASGREAIGSIESGNFYNLYVLDYRMPEMTGLELAARIRLMDEHAKILLISADVNTDPNQIFKNALSDGLIDSALAKPIYPNELLAAIDELQKTLSKSNGAFSVSFELEKIMSELEAALLSGDSRRADEVAHKIKGSVSFISNKPLMEAIRASITPSDVLASLKSLM